MPLFNEYEFINGFDAWIHQDSPRGEFFGPVEIAATNAAWCAGRRAMAAELEKRITNLRKESSATLPITPVESSKPKLIVKIVKPEEAKQNG